MKVFIGGSISIKKLSHPVLARLDKIMSKKYHILVGDAPGVDLQVQKYLAGKQYLHVQIFHIGKCRNNVANWPTCKIATNGLVGRKAYMQKDKEMAKLADCGLQVWDGRSTGTMLNILNLAKDNKYTLVWFKDRFFTGIYMANIIIEATSELGSE